jgi:hypothetical protein
MFGGSLGASVGRTQRFDELDPVMRPRPSIRRLAGLASALVLVPVVTLSLTAATATAGRAGNVTYLYMNSAGGYEVFVPAVQTNTSGTSWSGTDPGPGSSLPISRFFVANPSSRRC